jgi:two-component system, chemotaxis family, sensor kinase CheA
VRAADQYRIETIRVHTDRLDALLTQAGELTVAAQRIARRPEDIEELFAATEEWARSNRQVRRVMNEIYRGDKRGVVKRATIDRLREYLDEEHQRFERLAARMHGLKLDTGEDAAKIELIAARLEDGIRDARMVPMSAMFSLFSRTVRDLAREENKEVELVIEGGDTRADKRIVEEMKDPLMHMLRNSVDHGVETPDVRERAGKSRGATLRLAARSAGRNVVIEISDDGRGLDAAAILESARKKKLMPPEELAQLSQDQIYQLIFLPGFSTRSIITDVSGRGVGMDVVRANVERLKGSIQIETAPGKGSTFRIILPTALTTTRVLLIRAAGQMFAMPTDTVETTLLLPRKDVQSMEGRSVASIAGRLVPVARLAALLELPESAPETEREAERPLPALVISNEERSLVLIVDELLDEQEIILKHAGGLLRRVRNTAGAAILESGSVCIVLNPRDLIQSESRRRGGDVRITDADATATRSEKEKYTVLLAEDSITTRMQEKRILERAGYEVITAVDGLEAYQKLTSSPGKIDALVSDVEMPNMDGFTLTARLRAHEEFRELPVVIVTTLASEEHRKRGMEAGANAYITKSGFNQGVLLETLRRLI